MQYAAIEIQGERVIIDANEYSSINKYGVNIQQAPYDESTFVYKIVYGAYIPQIKISQNDALKEIIGKTNYAIAYIEKDICRLSEMCAIETFDAINNRKIPFAALIKTTEIITAAKKQALSFFLRYSNLSPADNIFNRPGIFAIKDQERQIKDIITEKNWKNFMDYKRMIRCANKIA